MASFRLGATHKLTLTTCSDLSFSQVFYSRHFHAASPVATNLCSSILTLFDTPFQRLSVISSSWYSRFVVGKWNCKRKTRTVEGV